MISPTGGVIPPAWGRERGEYIILVEFRLDNCLKNFISVYLLTKMNINSGQHFVEEKLNHIKSNQYDNRDCRQQIPIKF